MQTFKDTETGLYWQFEDDVSVHEEDGGLVFTSPHGSVLEVPQTLVPSDPPPPYVPPDPDPVPVSRWQGREAMRATAYGDVPLEDGGMSVFDAVESLLAQPGTPDYYRTAWDEIQQFEPDSPVLLAIAAELGLTDAQLSALFAFATTLRA